MKTAIAYILFCGLSLFPGARPARALDSLGVGFREGILRWTSALRSSSLIAFNADSIWMWEVRPNSNLGPGIPQRRGFVLFPGPAQSTFIAGAEVMYDGDAQTAFDPDDFAESTEIERSTPLFVDLGATFRVNRIRLFPRLDPEHQARFLRAFSLATNDGSGDTVRLSARPFATVFNFSPTNPNREPVLDRRFGSREVRFIRIAPRQEEPWEIAELEVFSDGTLPVGQFVSVPLFARRGPRPIWGRVRFEGGDITRLPVTVQTRTGPTPATNLFFRLTGVGGDREEVSFTEYQRLEDEEKGPVVSNPEWSPWQTVTDGLVRSPGNRSYIQFRVLMSEPGTAIKRLVIEFLNPPIAEDLMAEIDPLEARAGEDTPFTLSLLARLRRLKADGTLLGNGDTGFQRLRLQTDARISAIEAVRVDDRPADFTPTLLPGEGALIRLWRRVLQDGTFIQIRLRARIFRDATFFELQALDRRVVGGEELTVRQAARPEDVDPLSLGGALVVRLEDRGRSAALLSQVAPQSAVFTPNGDGINEVFSLSFALLKLTRPAAVTLEIFDLGGRRVRRLDAGRLSSGDHAQSWDGKDERRRLVPPGTYVYQLRVEADERSESRRGVVGVVY